MRPSNENGPAKAGPDRTEFSLPDDRWDAFVELLERDPLCPGSGEWAGWGWQWRPCPVCQARVSVDEDTLSLVDHAKIEPIDRIRMAAED